jgi:hypothetical protein
MINKGLDLNLRRWLDNLATKWNVNVGQVAQQIGAFEIQNRMENYPKVSAVLEDLPVDMQALADVVRSCWALGGVFDAIRFAEFVQQGDAAAALVQNLIDGVPDDAAEAAERIDQFVEGAVRLDGYLTRRGPDRSGAALLSSLMLTCLHPRRFVDYRRNRWVALAKALEYEPLPPSGRYGMQLIWAGRFAGDIVGTETYARYWSADDPLWVIAGICWEGPDPELPQPDPTDVEEAVHFPEGAVKRRLHLVRERSQVVVARAKGLALRRDPMLRCEICGFSFAESFGDLGSEFIEAHHKVPLAKLEPGSKTKVEDLAMVCANCHRMLHRGQKMPTIDQLRAIVQSQRASI